MDIHDCPSEPRFPTGMQPWAAAALLALTLPAVGSAQVRDVISKEIAVGRTEAGLILEVDGAPEIDIAFRDGVLRIDGEEVGTFEEGSPLETAWRELLGTAVALDNGPLARALVDWEPPPGLGGRSLDLARRVDGLLESRLSTDEGRAAQPEEAPPVASDRLIRSLLERTDRLDDLAEALEGLRLEDIEVRIGEDVLVDRETELHATLVAMDSDVEVRGTVRGDVVVVNGTLRLVEGARVTGDVRLADSRLLDHDGVVEGSVVEVEAVAVQVEAELRDRLRNELREELRSEFRSEARDRTERDDGWNLLRPFRAVGRGLAGALGVLLNTAVLALLGWGVVFFAPDNLSVVTETVRRSPGRSGVVGLAGFFLLLPVWILGGLALIITIVGIFALPFWIGLFPLAVAVAVGLGFYGVASGIGEHLARRRYPLLDWVRASNAYTLVAGGLVVLAAPFLLANVVEMAAILGFLEGLLTFVGWLAMLTALCIGFGAVLVTRGGRRPDYYRPDPLEDDDWTDDMGPGPAPGGPPTGGAGDWFGTGPGTGATGPDVDDEATAGTGAAGGSWSSTAATGSEAPSRPSNDRGDDLNEHRGSRGGEEGAADGGEDAQDPRSSTEG